MVRAIYLYECIWGVILELYDEDTYVQIFYIYYITTKVGEDHTTLVIIFPGQP